MVSLTSILRVLSLGALFVCSPIKAESTENVRYSFSFKTYKSACLVRINNVPLLNNFNARSGTVTAGGDINSFSTNGKNQLELVMGALDSDKPETLVTDAWCEVVISRNTHNASEDISTLRLTVDSHKNIVASESSHPRGAENEGVVNIVQSPDDKVNALSGAGREITLNGIPQWAWEKARKVSEHDMPVIKEAYTQIWQAMKKRDVSALKVMAQMSSQEMAKATGFSADVIFESYDLPQKVQDPSLTTAVLKWDRAELVTYGNGRVFRLAEGVYQNSPLKITNQQGETLFTYNPYFAIIDGKVTIVR